MIALDDIKSAARKLGEAAHAERVILFGSYARGEAGTNSDVDLLIVAESDQPRFKRSCALYQTLRPYPFAMDLLVYTPQEFEQARQLPLSFISTVVREGKTLYAR